MKKNFWICAWSTFHEEFVDNLKILGRFEKKAVEDLLRYNPENWCRAYFSFKSKSASVDNNSVESFNSWILKARFKPMIRMLEEIRIKTMTMIAKLDAQCSKWAKDWSPTVLKAYKENRDIAHRCRVEFNDSNGYEVSEGVDKHIVKLDLHSCTCREWDLTGIPCPHALSAMNNSKLDPMKYISHFYSKKTFNAVYFHKIQPVRGQKFWRTEEFQPVEPPPVVKQVGRPKKQRKREINEPRMIGIVQKMSKGQQQRCGNCKKFGHNKRNGKKVSVITNVAENDKQPSQSTQRSYVHNDQLQSQGTQRSEVQNDHFQSQSTHRSEVINDVEYTVNFERIYLRNNNAENGYGVFYDPVSGVTTYHEGDTLGVLVDAEEGGEIDPKTQANVNVRFSIPSESQTRFAQRKKNSTSTTTRDKRIAFGIKNTRGSSNLSFKPSQHKKKSQKNRNVTQADLENEKQEMMIKKKAKNMTP
ncbi:hypothetical protein Cni_G15766 [Canna indica]|uniref:SWIM-type domain-containing protein n=1 Tax=Canna indica TaxID=4628 RepID=A0AAQ3KK17_9LILI|nr:hypothetical protein Cni_G15766 [Canna indica]